MADGEITLPAWLAESDLTLAELGAVLVFASLSTGDGGEGLAARARSPELREASLGLKAKGVLKGVMRDGRFCVTLDLDAALSSDPNKQICKPEQMHEQRS